MNSPSIKFSQSSLLHMKIIKFFRSIYKAFNWITVL